MHLETRLTFKAIRRKIALLSAGESRKLAASERDDMIFKVIVRRGEDNFFVANCPALKSCWSQGRSRAEALQNLQEAIALYLEPEPDEILASPTQEIVELTL